MLLLEYPSCTTCQKAVKWLEERKVSFTRRNIREENPTEAELTLWIDKYSVEPKKLFNTSGLVYKELALKDKLAGLTVKEQIRLLATNGMLVKRPLVVEKDFLLIGFKEKEWAEKIV